MEDVLVKREIQDNEEILLFYVDENGGNEEGVLTTVENIQHQAVELQQDSAYVIENIHEYPGEITLAQGTNLNDQWTDDNIQKLLIFYNDNKQTFLTGVTKKEHLWTVACKTMLIGKTPNSCELKLRELKSRWLMEMCGTLSDADWPYLQLCQEAFAEDESAAMEPEYEIQIEQPVSTYSTNYDQGVVVVKRMSKPNIDHDIKKMLELYLKYKKNFQTEYWRRGLWETIALEIGKEDGEYWQKRFLNYKHHYLRLLDKVKESGPNNITWPYMDYFDKIFEGDKNFQSKFVEVPQTINEEQPAPVIEWDVTEKTVLIKYCFDCHDEFEDPTVPNTFLWNEIGRLLDRGPDACKKKYEELRKVHLEQYIQGTYSLKGRIPIQILFDAVITKCVESKFVKSRNKPEELELWKTEELDEVVQFFYENTELYKDLNSHFVCWAAIAEKISRSVESCRSQWEDLVTLYKTILNDKKENPDMQIDWRYIELFDRIFDYGMDTNLLAGYEQFIVADKEDTGKIAAQKVTIKTDNSKPEYSEDEEFDERGFTKRTKRHAGDTKAWKILEYYLKNKDKFGTTNKNKHHLWEILGKKIGITATQCAHRFRNLKQVYTAYVQRELTKPEMPIVWQYYALCKKVFGYRAVKSKLRNGLADEPEEWTAKGIRTLIGYFAKHFDEIGDDLDDVTKWSGVASALGKSESACKEKFMELRKSYRKLRTMKTRNPDVKISWKYFDTMERIYSRQDGDMEVDGTEDEGRMDDDNVEHDEDDYQCIIVIPDGQDISQIDSSNIIIQQNSEKHIQQDNPKPINKWIKRLKKRLIALYINYVRSHKNQEIIPKEMWTEIASKLPEKTPVTCKRVFLKMKINYKKMEETERQKSPYHNLFQKVLRLKPNFVKLEQNKELKDAKVYKDVTLPDEKVEQALRYYLQHIEDFTSPRYEKKYLWTELAQFISEPVTKVFNKLNYLKQIANEDTVELANTPFRDLLKEIWAKEIAINLVTESEPKPSIEETNVEESWTDDEVEQLLHWYLSNLDKFKNPKFVRSYLWMEVSKGLDKSALNCSKKMSEIRTQYRNMVRETPELLSTWRFHDLCQRIYGTGKKGINSGP